MIKLKNITFVVLILSCLLSGTFGAGVLADDLLEGEPEDYIFSDNAVITSVSPYIDATAALVMEAGSGRVLYSKNPTVRKSIASTTKIMTAIVALENGDPEDIVTVSGKAAGTRGSSINLGAGQKFTLLELLYGMLMNSGNDAAVAIAEHIGGSVEAFAAMMNSKARELGADNTVYVTPHGLDAEGQYSTAYDLALITRYALKNPVFSRIVATNRAYIPGRQLYNTNELLELYPGADGVKTGYTGKAGRCLVASATRDGMRIISVVLGSPTRYKRAEASRMILDYSFNNYTMHTMINAGSEFKNIPVHRGVSGTVAVKALDTVELPLRQDELERLETRVFLPESLDAPIYAGTDTGCVEYLVDGEVVGQTILTTWEDVHRKGFFDYLGSIIGSWARMMREGIFMD